MDHESNRLSISEHTLHFVALSECELWRQMPDTSVGLNNKDSDFFRSVDDNSDHGDNCLFSPTHSAAFISDAFSMLCAIEIDSTVAVTEAFDINPHLNIFHREVIQKIIQDNYLDYENIPKIEHDYKMHIRLTSEELISHSPRRLS